MFPSQISSVPHPSSTLQATNKEKLTTENDAKPFFHTGPCGNFHDLFIVFQEETTPITNRSFNPRMNNDSGPINDMNVITNRTSAKLNTARSGHDDDPKYLFSSNHHQPPIRKSIIQIEQVLSLSDVQIKFNSNPSTSDHSDNVCIDINSDCGICLLPLYDSTPVYKLEKCDHVFHLTCVYRCLESRNIPNNCVKCYSCISREEEKKIKLIYKDEIRSRRLEKRAAKHFESSHELNHHEIENSNTPPVIQTIENNNNNNNNNNCFPFSLPHKINDKLTITNYGYFLSVDTRYPISYMCTSMLNDTYELHCEIQSNQTYQQDGDPVYVFKVRCESPPFQVEAFTQSELSKKIEEHLPHSTSRRRKKTLINVSQLFGLQNRKVRTILEQLRLSPVVGPSCCEDNDHNKDDDQVVEMIMNNKQEDTGMSELVATTTSITENFSKNDQKCSTPCESPTNKPFILDTTLNHQHHQHHLNSTTRCLRQELPSTHKEDVKFLNSSLKRKSPLLDNPTKDDDTHGMLQKEKTSVGGGDLQSSTRKKKRKIQQHETIFNNPFHLPFSDISFKYRFDISPTCFTRVKNFLMDKFNSSTFWPIFVDSRYKFMINSLSSEEEEEEEEDISQSYKTIAYIYMYTCHEIVPWTSHCCTLYDIYCSENCSMSLNGIMRVYECFCSLSQKNALQSDIIYCCMKTNPCCDSILLSMLNVFYKIFFQRKFYSNEELVQACSSIVSWSHQFFRNDQRMRITTTSSNNSNSGSSNNSNSSSNELLMMDPIMNHHSMHPTENCTIKREDETISNRWWYKMNNSILLNRCIGREISACENHVLYGLYLIAKSIDYFVMENLDIQTILLNLSVIIQHAEHVVDLEEIGTVIRRDPHHCEERMPINHSILEQHQVDENQQQPPSTVMMNSNFSEPLPQENQFENTLKSHTTLSQTLSQSSNRELTPQETKSSLTHRSTSSKQHNRTRTLQETQNNSNQSHQHLHSSSQSSHSKHQPTQIRSIMSQIDKHHESQNLLIVNTNNSSSTSTPLEVHSKRESFSGTSGYHLDLTFNHEKSQLTSFSSAFSPATKSPSFMADNRTLSSEEENKDFMINCSEHNDPMEEGEDEIVSFNFSSSSGSLMSGLKYNAKTNSSIPIFPYFE